MTNPLDRQVGGTHYRQGGIQPIQFAHWNRYDPSAFSVLKYVARHRLKNGRQDLEKARHFVEIRQKLIGTCAPHQPTVSMVEFTRSNNLGTEDSWALQRLEDWVLEVANAEPLLAAIDRLIEEYDQGQLSLLQG